MPASAARGRFSQNGEDGLIAFILERIGLSERTFVEIGASDGTEHCTRELAENGWRGVWVEADEQKAATALELCGRLSVEVVRCKVSRSNAASVVATSTVPNPEVLVVDIDGNDWHVLCACLSACQPRLVVEYNSALGPNVSWAMPYNEDHGWDGDRWHGVSYGLLQKRAPSLGYRLVACDPLGVNAFLVRADLVEALGRFDEAAVYSPPMYSAPFGHPWRSRHTSDVGLAWDDFAQISIRASRLYRVSERVVVILEVKNDSRSWLTSFGKYPFNLAALKAGDRAAAREPSCVGRYRHTVSDRPPLLSTPRTSEGIVEFALLQEQVQWLTDVPGWIPLWLDLSSNRFIEQPAAG